MFQGVSTRNDRNGLTLVELAVVIVLIGVLAAFGVPRFVRSAERSRAAEAVAYLSAVRAAEARFHAREGTYAADLKAIGVGFARPGAFSVPKTVTPGNAPSGLRDAWSLTLTRAGSPTGYGPYTVTFTQDGYDPANSTIDGLADLNPAVVPGR